MVRKTEQRRHSPLEKHRPTLDLQERWVELYGPLVAAQLEPDRRYSVVRIGSVEFAYTDTDRFVRALREAWDAGYVPEPRPSCLGTELADVAPRLRGVDCGLGDVAPADLERPAGRFSS